MSNRLLKLLCNGDDDGTAFIVMERLHGEPVDAIWEKHGSRLAVPAAVAMVDQLLDVLDAAPSSRPSKACPARFR